MIKNTFERLMDFVEQGYVPDKLVRLAIRHLCKKRLAKIDSGDCEVNSRRFEKFIREMKESCVAPIPAVANEQHYEVPSELFEQILGPRRKYSSCYWPAGVNSLIEAEDASLRATCERAEIENGMRILELGCGWGAVSLWIAEHYPDCKITAVSNSASQREYILDKAEREGLDRNLTVLTADMNDFGTDPEMASRLDNHFDRAISLEMFEHMRNYEELLSRISNWLTPEGKMLIHIFCHREFAYEFVDEAETDWMSRYFFSGGIMPSDQLMYHFQEDMRVADHWRWDGTHYQRTAEAWVANIDARREKMMPILAETYGERDATRWLNRWRLLFLAGAELFGYEKGQQWWVSHYLLENRKAQTANPRLNESITSEHISR